MWQLDQDILRVFRAEQGKAFLKEVQARQPVFVLTVAYSATVQLPGVSGAGVTAELRELTAAADAEILAHGKARCLPNGVPSNPTGAPGPSIITRAAFDLLPAMPYVCVDAGLKVEADVPNLRRLAGAGPAEASSTGHALGKDDARAKQLWQAGLELGNALGRQYASNGYLILAESVPGGTTTALGLLLGLGLNAEQRVSSSMPDNAHNLKLEVVQAGLAAAGAGKGAFTSRPLAAAAALGDPMQPAVAGMALAASAYCPVVLGGGTQMAAVLALAAALRQAPPPGFEDILVNSNSQNIALATTRWVSADPTADLAGLGAEIEQRFGTLGSPYFAANLDFETSRYLPMRLYEQGYVKEGVGAGAAAFAAMLATGCGAAALLPDIEQVYRRIVLGEEI
jgi:uncharacterized protein (TIGR00303 family)